MLATLSTPLDRPEGAGRHYVGEVFGQQPGSKKRKRAEVSVGTDGDTASLYDVRLPDASLSELPLTVIRSLRRAS